MPCSGITDYTKRGTAMKTMDIILIIIGVLLLAFTVTMIVVFWHKGAVPDTLITMFFGCLGTECGVMGWIKNVKEKQAKQKNKEEDEEC